MELQLANYFQQSLRRHRDIDERLQPLLEVIKEYKINSIHQLSKKGENQENRSILSGFEEMPSRNSSYRKYYSQNGRLTAEKPKSSNSNSPRKATKPVFKSNLQDRFNEPLIYRNPNSKIKKHLIETMRFQSLQSTSHKNKSNRFKNFIDILVQKQRRPQTQKQRASTSHKPERNRLVDNEQAQEIFDSCPRNHDQNLFKVKIRKKFWVKEKGSPRNISYMRDALCIKGMKQLAITIE